MIDVCLMRKSSAITRADDRGRPILIVNKAIELGRYIDGSFMPGVPP